MVTKDRQSQINRIKQCSTELELPKGQTIHYPGSRDSSLYYIVEGLVRFVLNSYDGNEKILYILGEGTFFNEEAIFSTPIITSLGFCETDCVLWKIDSSVHKELMLDSEFISIVLQGMIKKNQRMRQEIENLSFMSCKQRLLRIFASECNKSTFYDQDWFEVTRRYTHQDLAGIIGANRVTVSKLITELCEERQLRNLNRRIQIHRDTVLQCEKENTLS